MKIATNSFTLEDVKRLCTVLESRYNIKASAHKTGLKNQYNVYIHVESMPTIAKLCKPYTHPSMYYKFNGYM